MYCKRCGHKIPEGAAFCSVCGANKNAVALPALGGVKKLIKKLFPKKPAEKKTADKKPADKKPAEKKTADKKPADKNTADKKSADKKPVDKKPVTKSTGEKAHKPKWHRRLWPYIAASVVSAIGVISITGLLAIWTAAVFAPREVVIEFEDERLEQALREALGIWDRDIIFEDAIGLTTLDLSNKDIEDIETLGYFTDLTRLDISGNRISDIGALSGLTSLEELELGDNRISDITALSPLIALTRLSLEDNLISDISALSQLSSLQTLVLADNAVSDISALSGLSSLKSADFSHNRISDVSALASLSQLETLALSDNAVTDISALAACDMLCRIELQNNPVVDISAAEDMDALTYINLKGTRISDISAIAGKVQIDMDSQKVTELRLGLGDYFRLDRLKLPINIGDAAVIWSTSDESVLAVEEGIARATHIQDFVYSPFSKQAILTGQVESLSVVFEYHINVEHEGYTWDYEDKVTKYKSKNNVATGYAELILPAVENVVAMDIEYEITVTKGKIHAFAFRAFINDKEWKNFGKIDISQSAIGFAPIDFGEPVTLSKYWIVCTDGKTGTWSSFTFIDKIYYAQQEVDVSQSSKSPSSAEAV